MSGKHVDTQTVQRRHVKIQSQQDVQIGFDQIVDQRSARPLHHGERRLRVPLPQAVQKRRCRPLLKDGGRGKHELAGTCTVDLLGGLNGLPQLCGDLLSLLEKIPPGGCQGHMGRVAVKQAQIHFLFQLADLAADGSLGDKAFLCRFGKAQAVGHGLKIQQLLKCHDDPPLFGFLLPV